ncbi:MAG: dTMP kinase [Nanoarchaeota archaeon]|nr:dTMP kinase [Nanoarchaeota archaeon]
MDNKRGMFVVFEGIDGSGKGTQLNKLIEHIESLDKYQDVVKTHEPWKSKEIKSRLKEDEEAYSDGIKMAGLYIKDRLNHSEEIDNLLGRGYFVLCDRYKLSTCAYQWTQGVNLYKLLKMHEDERILSPTLNIFISTSAEIAKDRMQKRGDAREKFENFEFQRDLIAHYNNLINRNDAKELFGEVVEINGRGTKEEVAEKVKKSFNIFYNKWKENNN